MVEKIQISLDAMGGDNAPRIVIEGAALALERHQDIAYHIFGDEMKIAPLLDEYPKLKLSTKVHHSDLVVKMDDNPSQALRHARKGASMWLAIESVKNRESKVAVSAGNTGALMALSKFSLKTMANIGRPAIAAIWPTLRGESVVLDMGATIGADAKQLVDFSILGSTMAHVLYRRKKPTVGLLNIGVEEVKGLEEIRTAGKILREADLPFLDYVGFIEGDDVGKGTTDVVVTEGFVGNIALKMAEGTAKQIASYIRSSMESNWRSKIGYLLAKPAFDDLREKMDPRKLNGGVFLGLNGIVIKSHGGTDGEGFSAAVEMAYQMAGNNLIEDITRDLVHYHRNGFDIDSTAEQEAK